jgi:hypothetical protein
MTDRDDYLWNPDAAPDPAVRRLEEALRPLAYRAAPPPAPRVRAPLPRWSRAAALAAALAGAVVGWAGAAARPWELRPTRGAPTVDDRPVRGGARLRSGAWLATDAASAARVRVGRIGTADVGPGSRLRLVRNQGTEHRMALERGTLHARIWAPPRFFLVETPAALAVDLGCVYSLHVAPDGSGVLEVESGEVELVSGGRRSRVPAGSAARMRPGAGPGTPFPEGSSPAFRRALEALDFGPFRAAALDTVLREARGRATVTLWHLIPRVPAAERARVAARLAELAPPPGGVTPDRAARLDSHALDAWARALEPGWTTERVPPWKHAWRRAWSWLQRA